MNADIIPQPFADHRDRLLTIGSKPDKTIMRGDTIQIIHGTDCYVQGAKLKVEYAVNIPFLIADDIVRYRLFIVCHDGSIVPASICMVKKMTKVKKTL